MAKGLNPTYNCARAIGYIPIMDLLSQPEKPTMAQVYSLICNIQLQTRQLAVRQLKLARNSSLRDIWRWVDVTKFKLEPIAQLANSRELNESELSNVSNIIEELVSVPREIYCDSRWREPFAPPSLVFAVSYLFYYFSESSKLIFVF
jgi:hypothetical protein